MRRASVLGLIACLAPCAAASGDIHRSGIDGRVVAAPTCPVESVPPSTRCAPRPLAATLRVYRSGGGRLVATVHSAANGRFSVRLPGGRYLVRPQYQPGSQFPRPPSPRHVRVRPGRFTHITITYDTGIR